jgi:hypothetical protein
MFLIQLAVISLSLGATACILGLILYGPVMNKTLTVYRKGVFHCIIDMLALDLNVNIELQSVANFDKKTPVLTKHKSFRKKECRRQKIRKCGFVFRVLRNTTII